MKKALLDLLAVRLGSGFLFKGMRVVQSPGVVIDQGAIARITDQIAEDFLAKGVKIWPTLPRVTVRILTGNPRPNELARAEWLGGWRDRGEIELKGGEGWEERFNGCLRALLAVEFRVTPE